MRRDGRGVSSMQLDQAERGFSFRLGARSTCGWGSPARREAEWSPKPPRRTLPNSLHLWAGTSFAPRCRAIVAAAQEGDAKPPKPARRHRRQVVRSQAKKSIRATRTFQALRIFVNEELDEHASGAYRGRARAKTRRRLWWCLPSLETARQEFPGRTRQGSSDRGICESRRPPPVF